MKIKSSIFYLIVLIVVNIESLIKEEKTKTFSSDVCLIENYYYYYYSLMIIDTNLDRENEANMISSFISTRQNSNDLAIKNNNMNSNVEDDESMIENSIGYHNVEKLAENGIQNNMIETKKKKSAASLTSCKRKIRLNDHHLTCFKFEMLEKFIKKCLCYD